ncbi:MAG: rod shape-determining protein RodA [Flavobacteriales bacterium]|nr:rod shape-determining protein RodA [Flavobacteriales bacterium]MBK9194720.1 rod shape-determining protein RodA [Flavobacteriales bacterium]
MNKRENVISNLDPVILGIYVLLMAMGLANIYSASYDADHPNFFDQSTEHGKQALWIGISIVLGAAVMLIRGQFLRDYSYAIYAGVMVLLALVLLVGKVVNGQKGWFEFGSFSIQPSEFAKFATALALSRYLSGLKALADNKSRLVSALIIAGPAALILLQPDTGTALVGLAFILVLYREGLSGNILLLGILAAVLGILSLLTKDSSMDLPFTEVVLTGKYFLITMLALVLLGCAWIVRRMVVRRERRRYFRLIAFTFIASVAIIGSVDYAFENVLQDHQRDRILDMLGQKEDPRGVGYNVEQSKIAIGSGGLTGKGYLEGTHTKYKYVPKQSTDFIFCTVGEEWGFLGSVVLIAVFATLILRIILISDRQRSRFTRIYCYCVACIFFLHLAINIGMTVGLAPVIGIPLPFFSYGGSSLIGFSILIGILLRLDAERLATLR